ncbi:phosphoribosylformylglycinamidine synthase subunit PurQ, partial [bacterium]|nr:phosphoribosylformylglycinamidine synthase subunit PurQ [bacterium]
QFPINPNGAQLNIAGLYNVQGNVLALMPHPERGAWLRQIPMDLPGFGRSRELSALRGIGPGMLFFLSMKDYIIKRRIL